MSSEPDRVPDPADAARLAERCPALAADILALAIQSGEDSLALAIHDLRFLGRCTCAPSCDRLVTAPYEQRSSYVAELDPDEDYPVVWLGLSEDCETITDIQVLDAVSDCQPLPVWRGGWRANVIYLGYHASACRTRRRPYRSSGVALPR